MFVAFCRGQRPFEVMLRRMAGVDDGVRDALTRHTRPLTGAYYVAPSLPAVPAAVVGAYRLFREGPRALWRPRNWLSRPVRAMTFDAQRSRAWRPASVSS